VLISLLLILVSILCSVAGQLTLKAGMTQIGRIEGAALAQPITLLATVLTSPLVVLGLAFYVCGATVWLTVLSRVPLSFAYPSLALSYVITATLAWLVLGEHVPPGRWLGIAIISFGVVWVARS
jgi:drug/metabolite transporter (DMT)-like permease